MRILNASIRLGRVAVVTMLCLSVVGTAKAAHVSKSDATAGPLNVLPENSVADSFAQTTQGRQGSSRPAKQTTNAKKQNVADKVLTVKKGRSFWLSKKKAIKELPLSQMSAPNQKVAQGIIDDLSLFRELPTLSFQTDPRVYRFFLSHPDVAVNIWRAMGVSDFKMWQTSQVGFKADAGDGTSGDVTLLYTDNKQCVVTCNGIYDSPLLVKPIRARALLHLESNTTRNPQGVATVQHRIKMFVAFPSSAVETTAKIVSPISNRIVDRNFYEVSLFVHMMSTAMEQQPGWVEQLANRLKDVPDSQKAKLMKLTAEVYVSARKRKLAATMDPSKITAEQVMQPLRVASQKQ